MRETAHRPLLLGPTQSIQAQRGPVFQVFGVALVLQPEQYQVPGLVRAKARYLDVVAQLGALVLPSFPGEAPLVVVTRPPVQRGRELQAFPLNVSPHGIRRDALRRVAVVCAARRVNVRVA